MTLTPELVTMLIGYAVNICTAIAILVVGWLVAGWLGRVIQNRAEKTGKLDKTLTIILGKAVRTLIIVLTLIAVLNRFGVQTASLVALLGAAGLAIGLGLQGALSNVAAGIMLLVFRPFKVGDFVDFGTAGIVDEIDLFVTHMHTPDNIAMIVPNSKIWGNVIKNFAKNDDRRIELVFGIGYDDDMDKAVRVIKEIVAADSRCLKEPEPLVAIAELGDSSVNIFARPWVKRTDFLATKLDLTRKVKERFDAEGITIPYPQRDVHLFEAKAA